MIVITCYNPETPRSTTDEELLTTMLSALIRWNSLAKISENGAQNELQRLYYRDEQKKIFQILPNLTALLGLTIMDITELCAEDHKKCIGLSGKK